MVAFFMTQSVRIGNSITYLSSLLNTIIYDAFHAFFSARTLSPIFPVSYGQGWSFSVSSDTAATASISTSIPGQASAETTMKV